MNKTKLAVLLPLILVFVSGGMLGAFAYRLYSVPTVQTTGGAGATPPARPTPEEVRRKVVADMTSKVKLDPEQVKQLNAIMDQTHTDFEALREKYKPDWDALNQKREALMEKQKPEQDALRTHQTERIRAMLREDQRPLFETWRSDRERERQRKAREQHKKE
jgi:hypothetical protein